MFINSKVFIAFEHLIRTCSKSAKLFDLHTPGKPHDLGNYDSRSHEVVIIPNISAFRDVDGSVVKLVDHKVISGIMEIVKDARSIGFSRYDLILYLGRGNLSDTFKVCLHNDSLGDNYIHWIMKEIATYWGDKQPILISTKDTYPDPVAINTCDFPLSVDMVHKQLTAYGIDVCTSKTESDEVIFVIS